MAFKPVGRKQPGAVKAAGHVGKPFAPAPKAPVILSTPGQPSRPSAEPKPAAPARGRGARGQGRPG